ncbi:hypothetical protein [Sorangium sp. So ce394]|uniref:hypothetical protein n=1 Tax=Sorangium sp. So ce394 TaxID=3133310 RepID=UPI003F5B0F96
MPGSGGSQSPALPGSRTPPVTAGSPQLPVRPRSAPSGGGIPQDAAPRPNPQPQNLGNTTTPPQAIQTPARPQSSPSGGGIPQGSTPPTNPSSQLPGNAPQGNTSATTQGSTPPKAGDTGGKSTPTQQPASPAQGKPATAQGGTSPKPGETSPTAPPKEISAKDNTPAQPSPKPGDTGGKSTPTQQPASPAQGKPATAQGGTSPKPGETSPTAPPKEISAKDNTPAQPSPKPGDTGGKSTPTQQPASPAQGKPATAQGGTSPKAAETSPTAPPKEISAKDNTPAQPSPKAGDTGGKSTPTQQPASPAQGKPATAQGGTSPKPGETSPTAPPKEISAKDNTPAQPSPKPGDTGGKSTPTQKPASPAQGKPATAQGGTSPKAAETSRTAPPKDVVAKDTTSAQPSPKPGDTGGKSTPTQQPASPAQGKPATAQEGTSPKAGETSPTAPPKDVVAKDTTSAQPSPKPGDTGGKSTPTQKPASAAQGTSTSASTSTSQPAGQGSQQPGRDRPGAQPGSSSTTTAPGQDGDVTWIAANAVKISKWRTATGRRSRREAKQALPKLGDPLTRGGFPTDPADAKKKIGKRFPKGRLFSDAEWDAFKELSSTPEGQTWLKASGMLPHDQIEEYLSNGNTEKFRGFHKLHKPSKVVLASYVSRNSGDDGKRFEGTPPAAVALSMEARHTTDPARRDELKKQIDQGIAKEWAKTFEHTEPNDAANKAMDRGAVLAPKTLKDTLTRAEPKSLPKDEALARHRQANEVLKNTFHLLQAGAEIYDAGSKSHVPLRDVPVAKLLSHGGRVNIQVPAGSPPYALTEFLGITDEHGNPRTGVFKRDYGTHHVSLRNGKFKEEGGRGAMVKSKFDDTELYGMNPTIGGLGLKDFNGDVILPDGAHGHLFIGYRPPKPDRSGALQIGLETTGPGAPSTVGYVHNWRSTEKTANPISSVGGLKQDKIGDEKGKNARTVNLGKLGADWRGVLQGRADQFAHDVAENPTEAIKNLVGPREIPPQDTEETAARAPDEASDGSPDESSDESSDDGSDRSERGSRGGDRRDPPGDAASDPKRGAEDPGQGGSEQRQRGAEQAPKGKEPRELPSDAPAQTTAKTPEASSPRPEAGTTQSAPGKALEQMTAKPPEASSPRPEAGTTQSAPGKAPERPRQPRPETTSPPPAPRTVKPTAITSGMQAPLPPPAPPKAGWLGKKLGTGGHGLGGMVSNKGAADREQALADQYELQIGPDSDGADDTHFSHKMLDHIEKALGDLPPEHITGSPTLRKIIRDLSSEEAASAYDELTDTINIVNPPKVPTFIYSRLNRRWGWQRKRMDRGAIRDYDGVDKEQDKALGITDKRHVMGGVSDVLANGNLLKWTMRHEVAHSIDKLVDWRSLAGEDRFGGWKVHSDTRGVEQVARAILDKAGITDDEANRETDGVSLLQSFASFLHPPSRREDMAPLEEFPAEIASENPDLKKKLDKAVDTVKIAMAQPWTLDDGGASKLEVDGRIYHVDQYNNWVSYNADARNNAVSNYQFSTPAEWFAETYAANYDPNPAPKAQLTQAVRDFFDNELSDLVNRGRERWQRINENTRDAEQSTGNQPPAGSSANPSAASPSAITAGFAGDITTGARSGDSSAASSPRDATGGSQDSSPRGATGGSQTSPPRDATSGSQDSSPRDASGASQDGAGQETDGARERLGSTQAALQTLVDASKTWSHPATAADKQDAKKLLGDLMRSQGVDRSLVDRLAELIDDPDSLSHDQFAICTLQSVLRTQLTSDLSGFARVVAAEFTGKLFDREGKQIADFSLDKQGEDGTTTRFQATDDPIQSVIRGELPLKSAPIGNKLLQNGVKKAGAKRYDVKSKGRAWSDKHVLDYLLARGMGKMLSTLAPDQYQADADYTASVVPGYLDKAPTRHKGATGPSKKRGDLQLSADSLVTLFTSILGGDAQNMVAEDDYDVRRINDALARPEQAPFALATFFDGKGLVEHAAQFAKDPTTVKPFDEGVTSGTPSPHQVVIDGTITEDGDHYVVPLHTWQQRFSIKVKKDVLPSLFPVFTYGTYLPSQAPAASDATGDKAPESSAWSKLTTGGGDPLGTGGRGLGGLFSNKGAAEREQALADQYELQIGPGEGAAGKHFSHKMLDRIEKILGELPPDHVTGNPTLRAIIRDLSSERSASEYDELTDTINIVNPKLKNIEVPSWLYSRLNRGVSWQRYLMDRGAKADYDGISKAQDKALGITGRRQVMGGVSDALANGNLIKWTMRHEIAHSIDKLVDWRSLAGEDRFGGWKVHSDTRDTEQVARAIFDKAGITDDEANSEIDGVSLLKAFASFLHPPSRREDMAPLEEFPAEAAPEDPDLRNKLDKAVRTVKIAMAQPWTLVDGGATELEVDGRIYHVDQYDNWVSYNADARNNAVSNYQFSTPAEWFAETYASYYDPDPAPKARLTQDVRDFFENELPDLVNSGRERWQRINENTRNAEQSTGTQPPAGSAASAITSGHNPAASDDPGKPQEASRDSAPRVPPRDAPANTLAGNNPASNTGDRAADPQSQLDEIEEEPEPPSERAPDPETATPVEEVTWIVDKAVKNTIWRTDTGMRSRERAKHGLSAIQGPLSSSGFPPDPTTAKEQLGGRFPRGPLLSDAEWSAFEQLSSTPQGQTWLNASGLLTHEQVEQYLSGDPSQNPEQFRGFEKLHNGSKLVLASYVSRKMKGGEAGKRFEGTPPAAAALSMEARHTTDPARREELKRLIDRSIVEEWSKTFEYTEPNDAATEAINKGAVLAPKSLLNTLTFTQGKVLSKDEVVKRHGQSLKVLKNIFHLLQEGAEIYDGSSKSYVPVDNVPVAKLLSHGGRVNVQIPAGSAPYALMEHLGITDKNGKPTAGVFKRFVGTHHTSFEGGTLKEQGGQGAALLAKLDDTELYGINLAVGGLGLKDFNGDVILPDGAHGHMFIGYRPPKKNRPGALQIGMETTGPGAPSTVGYVHNWRSTEKTANPISSVGGLKQDKIGDESTKNARTVDLGKLGSDWAKTLKDRAERFEQELKQRGKDALHELLGPRTQPPQELQDGSGGSEQARRDGERRDPPGEQGDSQPPARRPGNPATAITSGMQAPVRPPAAGAEDSAAASATADPGTDQPSRAPTSVSWLGKKLGTGGHGYAGMRRNEGAADREQALADQYELQIGPDDDGADDAHFSHKMLDHIEKALGDLPPEHITGSPTLRKIIRDLSSKEAASAYDELTDTINIVNPPKVRTFIYSRLNRRWSWQRKRMDRGAIRDYDGVDKEQDRALGITEDRHVMGGVSDVLANGNLIKWTMRHEVAHSVDKLIDWKTSLAGDDRFGGWKVHSDTRDLEEVTRAIFAKAGITDAEAAHQTDGFSLLQRFTSVLDPAARREDMAPLESFPAEVASGDPDLKKKLDKAVGTVKFAMAQPWTLDDGGASKLAVGGRIYHVDQYNNWVSYRQDARNNAVSNYQFSTPAEWFAETYASYYDPNPAPKARLTQEVRDFFANDLPGLINQGRDTWERIRGNIARSAGNQPPAAGSSAITTGLNNLGDGQTSDPADMLGGYNPASNTGDKAADPQAQFDQIEEEPEPPSERAPDPETATPVEEVTWIVDKAVKKTIWRTDTGMRSRERAKHGLSAIQGPLSSSGFPPDPTTAKEQLGGRFPRGPLLSDAEWSAFEQLSSTPQGQTWLNASGLLTHEQVEQYLSGDPSQNPEQFRGFEKLHNGSKLVLASYVSRKMKGGEAGKRFEGTPPAAAALSMEARHTTDPARREELKRLIDRSIVEEWSKTFEYTEPNDAATEAINKGAVLAPKSLLNTLTFTKGKELSKDEVVKRHGQSLKILKNIFHLLQEGAEIYDGASKSYVPVDNVPVAKLLSHGGRVNVQIPAGSAPYALMEHLGITDKNGKPTAGVFKRFVGTHHTSFEGGTLKEQGGQGAALLAKLDDTELYGINLAVGGLGLKDFNGDVILPDGAHGHMFIGYRPPKKNRPGALQIGMETTGPGAPSTVGYVHNWRSTEKTSNPVTSVGALKLDKIGDASTKNARTVDLGKLGSDWAKTLKDRAERFEQELKQRGKDALHELLGPRTQPPQELQDDGVGRSGDMLAGAAAPGATPSPTPTTAGGAAQVEPSAQDPGKTLDELLDSLDKQSRAWAQPATDENKKDAIRLLTGLLQHQNVRPSVIDRLRELIENPASLSQSAFTNCALTSILYPTLKDDLATTSHLVAAIFTGKLLGKFADSTGAAPFQPQGSGKGPLSDSLDLLRRVMTGDVPQALGPAPTRPLVNGLRTAKAKGDSLKEATDRAAVERHLLDHLLARGLVEMLGPGALAKLEQQTDRANQPSVAAAQGDLLASANSISSIFNAALGANATVMTKGSPGGYDVTRVNDALQQADQAGFAIATVMDGEALWSAAEAHEASSTAPYGPVYVARLGEPATIVPHHAPINGEIKDQGDSFLVPLQSWGRTFPVRVNKEDMPKVFAAITYGTALPSRAPSPTTSSQVQALADVQAGYNPASSSGDAAADAQAQLDAIEEEPEPPSERAPDPETATPVEEVTWIVDKAVKNTIWRTDTGMRSRERAKQGLSAIQGPLSSSGFPPDPTTAKEQLGGRFPRGPLLSDAEWSAFEQLSSTPQGQTWLNASGLLTHEQVEQYLSGDPSQNPEQFRGFEKLHNGSKLVLASYVSRKMKGGEAGKRFEGTPPAAAALSMEARHTTDPARREELKRLIDRSIVEEWSKTFEYTEPNDAATEAINKGAVLAPKSLLNTLTFTKGKELSKDEGVKRHGQSLKVLKNIFHLLQEGAEIYDGSSKSYVPVDNVPVAKLLSHGGRVNVQIPAGSAPYALMEHLGITDKNGKPTAGVFKRFVGTHHTSFEGGTLKEQGGQGAALLAKLDDTELYGINLAVGGLGLKDFNGDVILPDGAHGHMFIGYRPPKKNRPGALQIGMETTGPGAPSTVGYVHNWRSTEKTANPISSVGGLKQDKIGDESTKNARTVDLGKLGSDWAKTLKDRAERFEQELKQRGKDALHELLGPRTQPPQELQDTQQRSENEPGDDPADMLGGYNPASSSGDAAADPQAQLDAIEEEPEPPSERAPDPETATPVEEVTWIVDKAVKNTIWRTDTGMRSRERAKHGLSAIQGPLSSSGFPPDPTTAKEQLGGRFPRGPLLSDAEWSAFEQLSSTPQGQTWLNASGLLTHEQVEQYLSGDPSQNPEQFRGFEKLHNGSKLVLASYVSRQMKGGEAGKRFEGTPPAAAALSMEARHTTDPARREELKRLIDRSIVEEWSKTFEYTEPNDAATEAINKGAVLAPKSLLNTLTLTKGKVLSKDEVVKRHGQSLKVLKNIFHLLQEGAEIYDGASKSYVPVDNVPVAKLLSHGGRVNVQIPAGSAPYALMEHLGITDKNGKPTAGVFKRFVGTHHTSFEGGTLKEQGGQGAALLAKLDDTELYGINLAVGGLGLKDFNGDVILPDGAHGHMFIGYRPPKKNRPGALQIGMETTGPGAPSTVGYVHNWRSTEKTANPISSVGGLKQDKIGDESTKNARTVDLGKLGSDWAKTLKDRAERFEQELKQRGKDALHELLGPRTQPPQELQDSQQRSGDPAQAPRDNEPGNDPGDTAQRTGAPANVLAGYNPALDGESMAVDPLPRTGSAQVEPSPQNQDKTLDELLSELEEQSRAWSGPANDELRRQAADSLTGLLESLNVDRAIVDRLRELIKNPASLSQSAFSSCGVTSALYTTLKGDLATTSHLVVALFTGRLLGRLAQAPGARELGAQPGPGRAVLSEDLDILRRVMTGEIPRALGPAPTRPLVNGLKTAGAKRGALTKATDQQQLDRHLLDHLLSRGLVELLGQDAVAQHGKRTDGAKQAGVAAAQGDMLLSANSIASLMSDALGAEIEVMSGGLSEGDVARINETLRRTDRPGFAVATIANGKALWEAAKQHRDGGDKAPRAPATVAPLGKDEAESRHHFAIDGEITVDGDAFLVPVQSWGQSFPIRVPKADMPRLFEVITVGTYPPPRAPAPGTSAEQNAPAHLASRRPSGTAHDGADTADLLAGAPAKQDGGSSARGPAAAPGRLAPGGVQRTSSGLYQALQESVPQQRLNEVMRLVDDTIGERLLPQILDILPIELAAAKRLAEEIVEKWLMFHPGVRQLPPGELQRQLAAHVELVVRALKRDQGLRAIGRGNDAEENGSSTGETPPAAAKTNAPQLPERAPGAPVDTNPPPGEPESGDESDSDESESDDESDSDESESDDESDSDESESDDESDSDDESEGEENPFGGLEIDLEPDVGKHKAEQREKQNHKQLKKPKREGPAQKAIPEWLWGVPPYEHLQNRLIERFDDDTVRRALTGLLATERATSTSLARFLNNRIKGSPEGKDPKAAFKRVLDGYRNAENRRLAFDVAKALGALDALEGRQGIDLAALREPPPPPPQKGEEETPRAILKRAKEGRWVTTEELGVIQRSIGERAFAGMLARAMDKGKVANTRGIIEQLVRHAERLSDPALSPPLTSTSLVVDSNLVADLLTPIDQLSPARRDIRDQLESLIRDHKITDLRLANINIGELFQHDDIIGSTFTTADGRVLPWYGIRVDRGRRGAMARYDEGFEQLTRGSVGEKKGSADRSMLADAFFSERAGDGDAPPVPHFATNDNGILTPLLHFAGIDAAERREKPFDKFVEEKTGGTTYFSPKVQGREIKAHAILTQRRQAPPAPEGAAPARSEPIGASLLDTPVGSTLRVHDLISLISTSGFGVYFVGGAVRDALSGIEPRDVDLKTNMPMSRLEEALRREYPSLPVTTIPDLGLLQVGGGDNVVDITAGDDTSAPGPFDVMADAQKRDFRMNAIYLDKDGYVVDPLDGIEDQLLGRLRFVADPGPGATVEERQRAVVEHLHKAPWNLGRALKFYRRGYVLEPEILNALRDNAESIIDSMKKREAPLRDKSLFLHQTRAKSPDELLETMEVLGFPRGAMHRLIPDEKAGRFDDESFAYDHDILPRWRDTPDNDARDYPLGAPEMKVDVATGRIYQYRFHALLPPRPGQAAERVIIDVDLSDHNQPGHNAPHYHVYRWRDRDGKAKWDKKKNGFSDTGQQGQPRMDGDYYRGPQPWRFDEELNSDSDDFLADAERLFTDANIEFTTIGDQIDLGGQVRLHRDRLRELHRRGQLGKLLTLVQNLNNGIPWSPRDQATADLSGSHRGQERLRFKPQLDQVEPFLRDSGIEDPRSIGIFAEGGQMRHDALLRLYDLVSGEVRPDLRRPAAAFALERASSYNEFVERFEFYIASMQDNLSGADVEALWQAQRQAAQEAGAVGDVTLGDGDELRERLAAAASELRFESASTAAYHAKKHAADFLTPAELAAASQADVVRRYLDAARDVVRNATAIEARTDETGATNVVLWHGANKAIARVRPDGTAHLLTSYAHDRRDIAPAAASTPPPGVVAKSASRSGAPSSQVSNTGIVNIGNSCFLSAGLTMLAHTDAYYDLFAPREGEDLDAAGPRLRAAVRPILEQIRAGTLVGADTMRALDEVLRDTGVLNASSRTTQQDPSEVLFRRLFERASLDTAGVTLAQRQRTDWRGVDLLETGETLRDRTSLDDNLVWDSAQPDVVLSPLVNGSRTLQQALDGHFGASTMDDVAAVRQGRVVRGSPSRQLLVDSANNTPRAITIALQRGDGENESSVDVPEWLDVNGRWYRLNVVVNHHGPTGDAGHYTAMTRNAATGQWQVRDDRTVSDADPRAAAERRNRGYLFTFERVDDAARGPDAAAAAAAARIVGTALAPLPSAPSSSAATSGATQPEGGDPADRLGSFSPWNGASEATQGQETSRATDTTAALDAVTVPPEIDALVRTLVKKSDAWSSPRTQADKQEAIALVTELLQQLGMDAKVVDRAGEQGKDSPDSEHSTCTCVR